MWKVLYVSIAVLMAAVGAACVQPEPTPTPTPTPDFSPLRRFIKGHDASSQVLRAFVRQLAVTRTSNDEWAERQGLSISTYGIITSGNLLEIARGLAERAELKPVVQKELESERADLRTFLETIKADEARLQAVTLGIRSLVGFRDTALRALLTEREILETLLVFYESEDFILKGKGSQEFTVLLAQAPGRLLEALTFWESAKVRVEAAIKE